MKKCTKCGIDKPVFQFSLSSKCKDGRTGWCKECVSVNRRKLYRERGDFEKERRALYREVSPYTSLCQSLLVRLKGCPTEDPITPRELYNKWVDQDGKCALSGVEMVWSGKGKRHKRGSADWNSMSIDRIDQSLGYTRKNVRLVCFSINAFRGRMTDEEMIKLANLIVRKSF